MLDMLKVRGVEQDVIDNIVSHTPQLALPKLPQMTPVDEGHIPKKRKPTNRNSDQELIHEMVNSMAYDEVNAPTIDEPMGQANYDLSTLQQILETAALSLSCVERYQLNNIYNVGQWLLLAQESFRTTKEMGILVFWSNNFVDWVSRVLQNK